MLDIPVGSIVLRTLLLHNTIQSNTKLKAHLNKHYGHNGLKQHTLGLIANIGKVLWWQSITKEIVVGKVRRCFQ
jgi:hypothetical protein